MPMVPLRTRDVIALRMGDVHHLRGIEKGAHLAMAVETVGRAAEGQGVMCQYWTSKDGQPCRKEATHITRTSNTPLCAAHAQAWDRQCFGRVCETLAKAT